MAASLRVKRPHGASLRSPSPALLHRLKSCGFGDSAPSLDDTADTKAKNYTWPVIEMRKVKGFFRHGLQRFISFLLGTEREIYTL